MLPVQSAPAPGESLHSWVARIAALNGLPAAEWPINRNPTDAQLERTSQLTGKSRPELDAMLISHYPSQVRGWGPQELGGWRTDRFHWTCKRCSAWSGVRLAAWNLAVQPLCHNCHLLLTNLPDETPVPTSPQQELLCTRLTRRVELSIASKHYRRQLHDLRRLITLVAQTIDPSWPLRDESIPPEVWQHARLWGRHPTPSPRAAVLLLEATNPFARSADDTAALIGEGWRRLDQRFGAKLPVPPSYLPPRPKPPRQQPNPTWQSRDRERLKQLRAYLQSLAMTTGLAGHHVPGLLFTSLEYPLPPVEAWPTCEKSAFVLHLLLTGDSLGPARVAKGVAAFGLSAAPDTALQYPDGVGRGIGAILARQLKEAAALLVEEGLVDYQRRRQLFGARVPLPAQLLRRLPTSPSAELLARSWLWIHFTRSRLSTSPHPEMSDGQVLAFDAALDAETRLLLHEAGSAWIATTDTLPWATTAPPATVRQETA